MHEIYLARLPSDLLEVRKLQVLNETSAMQAQCLLLLLLSSSYWAVLPQDLAAPAPAPGEAGYVLYTIGRYTQSTIMNDGRVALST